MALRIGVIALESAQTDKLCDLLVSLGVEICFRLLPGQILDSHIHTRSVDVWLLNVDDEHWCDRFDDMLEKAKVPVFFNEPSDIDHQQHLQYWAENLIEKLMGMVNEEGTQLSDDQALAEPDKNVAVSDLMASIPRVEESELHIWVLGASLGGPAAVKRFLHQLPQGLDVGFILAQHIDANFLPSLAKILQTEEGFDTVLVDGSHLIKHGDLVVTPVESRLVFTPAGIVGKSDEAWSSDYSPCINDIVSDVTNTFKHSGAIIFSGMGDDAVEGCRQSKAKQRPVWCQSAETCANSTMPDAVRNAGLADYSGSPEELADKLSLYLNQKKHMLNQM